MIPGERREEHIMVQADVSRGKRLGLVLGGWEHRVGKEI